MWNQRDVCGKRGVLWGPGSNISIVKWCPQPELLKDFRLAAGEGFIKMGASSWVFKGPEVINEKGKLPWACRQESVLPKQGIWLLLGEKKGDMPLQTPQVSTSVCCAAFIGDFHRGLFIENEITGGVFWLCFGPVLQILIWGSGEGWSS